jgi:hypothetical protein
MLLRLRIALPDRPGSLGQVTRVLGAAGADITQVTVLDRGEGRALDDFTVFWPDSVPRDNLLQGLSTVPGVQVEGVWATREAPGTFPELEILKYLATAGDRALATLIDSMPVLFSADWAAACAQSPHETLYSSWRAPGDIALPETIPPRPHARTLPAGPHVITAPVPPLDLVLILARAEGPAFHRMEVDRLIGILEIFFTLPSVISGTARTFRTSHST